MFVFGLTILYAVVREKRNPAIGSLYLDVDIIRGIKLANNKTCHLLHSKKLENGGKMEVLTY